MTDFRIDAAAPGTPLDHFWRSTGFTPASLLLTPQMRQTIQWLGAVPHQGIRHCRIHFLLDLVTGKGLLGSDPVYDWTRLDQALDVLVANGLAPFFELMGNPGEAFTDFSRPEQCTAWRRLVKELATRCIARYGSDEVRSWWWETWNEPDLPWWKHSRAAFLTYYDACWQGLREVDPQLRFGGPGTCETLHPLFTDLMDHVAATGAPLDFISIHEKGGKWSGEDVDPSAELILDQTRKVLAWLRERHPDLATRPFVNDECDPLIGWKDTHSFHGRPYYASFLCRLLSRHLGELRDGERCDFALLSSDNGFLGRWGQRSLLAGFGDGQGALDNDRFELIKKPVLGSMALLALLGDTRLPGDPAGVVDDLDVLVTRRGGQLALLVTAHRDRIRASGTRHATLRLRGLTSGTWRLAQWRIDEDHGNPMAVWEAAGYPDDPSKDPRKAVWPDRPDLGLYAQMRAAQEPVLTELRDVAVSRAGTLELSLDLPLHAVALLVLDRDPGAPPATPQGLRGELYPGRTPQQNLLLRWDCLGDRHLRGYRVECAPDEQGPWESLSTAQDLLSTAWLHPRDPVSAGLCYRVLAMDLWDRSGPPSAAFRM